MITKLTEKSAAASIALFKQFKEYAVSNNLTDSNWMDDMEVFFLRYVGSLTVDPAVKKLEEQRKKALAKLTLHERQILGLADN